MTGLTEMLIYAAVSFVAGWLLPPPKLPGGSPTPTPAPNSNPLRDILLELLKQRLSHTVASESKSTLLDDETKAIMELISKPKG